VEFLHGSALALPFGMAGFDRAYTIHAGMNIALELFARFKGTNELTNWLSKVDAYYEQLLRLPELIGT
jgi:hypothetical protein